MIKIYDIEHSAEWDAIVHSFADYDVYYLSGYVRAFQLHGDGIPYLLYYESDVLRAIYVYMKRATALLGVYDSITPYGYGGVLFEGVLTEQTKNEFWKAYLLCMEEEHIVDNFVRYHPVLSNANSMRSISDVVDLGKTISMDLSSETVIWDNIASKNRNMIRKAEKNGVEIMHGKGKHLLHEFIGVYNATMKKDNAESYYYFKEPFYDSIDTDLHDNYELFWAEYNGIKIAMSIMIFANNRLNYHLSGSVFEYRNLAPSNLLLYKAALWGCEQGMHTFHLGGGVGSGEDNLYKFKAAFNKNSDNQFSIGKQIFCQEQYDELVRFRAESDTQFNSQNGFFPLYRS